MATDVLAMMDQESTKAKAKAGGFKPTFLLLKDKQKALIRPLFNLNSCLVLAMHNKFNQTTPKDSVNAVCAKEIGQGCYYCDGVPNDRKLSAGLSFMLPVWVYAMKEQQEDKSWTDMTYTDSTDNSEKKISGLRILELKAFGTINDVLQFLRAFYAEDDAHDITLNDFIIERHGAGQGTTYTTMPKAAKEMHPSIKALVPSMADVRGMVLLACPPSGYDTSLDKPPTAPAQPSTTPTKGQPVSVPEF